MEINDQFRQKLRQSAERAEHFWNGVKDRLTISPLNQEETFELIDIQRITDDCIDLIAIRHNKEQPESDQMEHIRITVEKRFLRKPKISFNFTSGPFVEDFFKENK